MRLPWQRTGDGATATAESPGRELPSLWQLRSEIDELTAANRAAPDPERERAILRARHLAGVRLVDEARAAPQFPNAGGAVVPEGDPLPEFRREELTAELLRAAILRDGCVLVRALIPRYLALELADGIDTAYARREAVEGGEGPDGTYYDEFVPDERFGGPLWRSWIKEGGGLLAADSPHLSFQMHELFARAELPSLVADYLGEPPLISAHKTTLRRAEPSVSGAWHQDGFFMGPVRSLNLWLSLSRCGDEAPGLDILPRRLSDYVATGTSGAELGWTISEQVVEETSAGVAVVRPIFEPGDALLFDELFLHKTGSDPSMPNPRFAIENWFFGALAFPGEYAPIAV